MKNLFTVFIVSVLFLGCSSNDEDIKSLGRLQLKSVMKNGALAESSEYYDNKNIKSVTRYADDESIGSIVKYVYENNSIYQYNYNIDDTDYYSYNKSYKIDDEYSKIEFYNTSDELNYFYDIRFSDNSCGADELLFKLKNNEFILQLTFLYLNENCDVEVTVKNIDGFNSKTSYINDDKNYYGANNYTDFQRINSPHNTIERRIFEDDITINERSYNSIFTYNSNNYPIHEERTFLDGRVDEYTYEYY